MVPAGDGRLLALMPGPAYICRWHVRTGPSESVTVTVLQCDSDYESQPEPERNRASQPDSVGVTEDLEPPGDGAAGAARRRGLQVKSGFGLGSGHPAAGAVGTPGPPAPSLSLSPGSTCDSVPA